MISPLEQLRILMAMMLCGAILGAGYDFLCILRCLLFPGIAMRNAQDLIFGVVYAGGIVLTALWLRTEAMRWYSLLGAAMGAGLYRYSLGAYLRKVQGIWVKFAQKKRQKKQEKAR